MLSTLKAQADRPDLTHNLWFREQDCNLAHQADAVALRVCSCNLNQRPQPAFSHVRVIPGGQRSAAPLRVPCPLPGSRSTLTASGCKSVTHLFSDCSFLLLAACPHTTYLFLCHTEDPLSRFCLSKMQQVPHNPFGAQGKESEIPHFLSSLCSFLKYMKEHESNYARCLQSGDWTT